MQGVFLLFKAALCWVGKLVARHGRGVGSCRALGIRRGYRFCPCRRNPPPIS